MLCRSAKSLSPTCLGIWYPSLMQTALLILKTFKLNILSRMTIEIVARF